MLADGRDQLVADGLPARSLSYRDVLDLHGRCVPIRGLSRWRHEHESHRLAAGCAVLNVVD